MIHCLILGLFENWGMKVILLGRLISYTERNILEEHERSLCHAFFVCLGDLERIRMAPAMDPKHLGRGVPEVQKPHLKNSATNNDKTQRRSGLVSARGPFHRLYRTPL